MSISPSRHRAPRRATVRRRLRLDNGLAMVVCAWILALLAGAASAQAVAPVAAATATPSATPAATAQTRGSPYLRAESSRHAVLHSQAVYGVDGMRVTRIAADGLIRFSYHVVDPARAGIIVAKGSKPVLVGMTSHAMLHVPVMDKVGELRQSGELVQGKDYWMVFSNKGNLVKPGERVNVVVGTFHADGLLVE